MTGYLCHICVFNKTTSEYKTVDEFADHLRYEHIMGKNDNALKSEPSEIPKICYFINKLLMSKGR
jgi:hypothetical protein